jgi:phosphoglycolate phosphatase
MTPDALIFDLDGTLWDAAPASTFGWNLALEEMGLPRRISDADIRSVSGRPFPECAATLLPELVPIPQATIDHLEARERTGIELIPGDLYPGVAEGLRQLAERYPLFLVSNCPGWYLEAFFRHRGLQECFTGWDCWGLSGISKSGMLLNLAERYRLESAVYVGDTRGDCDATEAAGLTFAFVEYGFGSVDDPALAFEDFAALVQHFMRTGTGADPTAK